MNFFGPLETFVLAAETRNFTEAGRRLGVSSSAVGRAIAGLERQMGVRLLHRSTRAISLTAEGEVLLTHCHRMFAEFEAARNLLTEASGQPRGRLRIGMPQLGMHLMEHLTAFQTAYPEIELELDFSDRLVNVIEEGFDAVMRIGHVEDSRLTMRTLKGYHHRLVASPEYLARRGHPRHPDELRTHACLRYRYPTSGKLAPWPLWADGQPVMLDLPQSAVTNAVDPLVDMALAGIGIALVPDFMAAELLAGGELVSVLDGYVRDPREFCVLWPAGRQSLPKIKAFVTFMAERLGGDASAAAPSRSPVA